MLTNADRGDGIAGPAGDFYEKKIIIRQPKILLPLSALPTHTLYERAEAQADLTRKNEAAIELFKRDTAKAEGYQSALLIKFLRAENRAVILAGCGINFGDAQQKAQHTTLKTLLLVAAAIHDSKYQAALFSELKYFAATSETFPLVIMALSFYQGEVTTELFAQTLKFFQHKTLSKKSTKINNTLIGIKIIALTASLLTAEQTKQALDLLSKLIIDKDELISRAAIDAVSRITFRNSTQAVAVIESLFNLALRYTQVKEEAVQALHTISAHLDVEYFNEVINFYAMQRTPGGDDPKTILATDTIQRLPFSRLELEEIPEAIRCSFNNELVAKLVEQRIELLLFLPFGNKGEMARIFAAIEAITSYAFLSRLTPERLQATWETLMALVNDSQKPVDIRRVAINKITELAPLLLTTSQIAELIQTLTVKDDRHPTFNAAVEKAKQVLAINIPESGRRAQRNHNFTWDSKALTFFGFTPEKALAAASKIAKNIGTGLKDNAAWFKTLFATEIQHDQPFFIEPFGIILRHLPAPLAVKCWQLHFPAMHTYNFSLRHPSDQAATLSSARLATSQLLEYIPSTAINAEQLIEILNTLNDFYTSDSPGKITTYQQMIPYIVLNIARLPYHLLCASQILEVLNLLTAFSNNTEFETSLITALKAIPFHLLIEEDQRTDAFPLLQKFASTKSELKEVVDDAINRMPLSPAEQTPLTEEQLKTPLIAQTEKLITELRGKLAAIPSLLMEAKQIAATKLQEKQPSTPEETAPVEVKATLENYVSAAAKHSITRQQILDAYPWLISVDRAASIESQPTVLEETETLMQQAKLKHATDSELFEMALPPAGKTGKPNAQMKAAAAELFARPLQTSERLRIAFLSNCQSRGIQIEEYGINLEQVLEYTQKYAQTPRLKVLAINFLLQKASPEQAAALLAHLPALMLDINAVTTIVRTLRNYHKIITPEAGENSELTLAITNVLHHFSYTDGFSYSSAKQEKTNSANPEWLISLLKSGSVKDKRVAAFSIKKEIFKKDSSLLQEILNCLLALLQDDDRGVQIEACRALGRLPLYAEPAALRQSAFETLLNQLRHNPNNVLPAIALTHLPLFGVPNNLIQKALTSLLELCAKKPSSSIAEAIAYLISEMPTEQISKVVNKIMANNPHPLLVSQIAIYLSPQQAQQQIERLLPTFPKEEEFAAASTKADREEKTEQARFAIGAMEALAAHLKEKHIRPLLNALLIFLKPKHYKFNNGVVRALYKIPVQLLLPYEQELIKALLPLLYKKTYSSTSRFSPQDTTLALLIVSKLPNHLDSLQKKYPKLKKLQSCIATLLASAPQSEPESQPEPASPSETNAEAITPETDELQMPEPEDEAASSSEKPSGDSLFGDDAGTTPAALLAKYSTATKASKTTQLSFSPFSEEEKQLGSQTEMLANSSFK